jgi:L,D-peptidoglycan transpeptidase YkuD (ErfK/YbiS/YcfS/YnhG family)
MTPYDMVVTPSGLRFGGRVYPCTVGRGGVVQARAKREGDGATPAGVHRLVGLLYRPDRIARDALPDWALPLRPRDLWCDDPDSDAYNLMVTAPFDASHEHLWRADPMYDVILVTDWNWPHAQPGRGSAIFVHSWRRPGAPTVGCVALARGDLLSILPGIRHRTRLIIRP